MSPFCYPLYPSRFLSLCFLPCTLSLFLLVSNRHLLFLHCCYSIFRLGVIPFTKHIVPTYEDTVISLSWEVLEAAATYISALILDTPAHDLTSTSTDPISPLYSFTWLWRHHCLASIGSGSEGGRPLTFQYSILHYTQWTYPQFSATALSSFN